MSILGGTAQAQEITRVYGAIEVEAHSPVRLSGGRSLPRNRGIDSDSAIVLSLNEMPVEVHASTVEPGTFAGTDVRAALEVEPITMFISNRSWKGMAMHLDTQVLIFPDKGFYERSVIRATMSAEFTRTSNSNTMTIQIRAGSRMSPGGWRDDDELARTLVTNADVTVEQFISGGENGEPERWEVIEDIVGNPLWAEYEGGIEWIFLEMEPGRYRVWVDYERIDFVSRGEEVHQVQDGVHLKLLFNTFLE